MTVETAVIMPALVLLLAVLLATAAAGMTTLRFEEAARASARAAARGESSAVVESTAREIAGDTASVAVGAAADRVTVTISGPAPGILGRWSTWRLDAHASAAVESPAGAPSDGGSGGSGRRGTGGEGGAADGPDPVGGEKGAGGGAP
ncbi:TadE family type IV pilus minor pilin [Kocuria tytonicola]|uniref:TadE family type IV pilus minor pilin n=1 Tax=Kocuria tytonicola TaxID=2055946 RepID=UPI001FB438FB|nr:TadE family type IV pilus minor pilin [Kocuria tytonicola]